MEFKTNIKVTVKTSIRCPRCKEKFDKPVGEVETRRCPHCGAQLQFSKEGFDNALREADAKVAGTLGSMGIPMPPEYAEIAKAKVVTKVLNIAGIMAVLWTFFLPLPYITAVVACALIPVVSLLAMAVFKERISFETGKKKTEAPYLTFALAAPPAALAWRALNDFHILAFDKVWLPSIALGIIFSVLISFFSADVKKKPLYILVALIFGFAYGYGVVIEAN